MDKVLVRNVEMLDYQGQKMLVTGLLSEDKKYVSVSVIRKFENTKGDPEKGIKPVIRLKWRPSTSGTGDNCTTAMGDNATFVVKNLGEPSEDGHYDKAELVSLTPTTQVTIMKHRDAAGVVGAPYVGSILDWKIVDRNGKEVMPMTALLPESLVKTIKASIVMGSKEKSQRPRNAEYAELAEIFTDEIAEPDPVKKTESQPHQGAVEGETAADAVNEA
jgi:hypothetical protein